MKICIFLICFLFHLIPALSFNHQGKDYEIIVQTVSVKLENTLNKKYDISGVIIDKSLKFTSNSRLKTIDDIYHLLQGCFIFIAAGESNLDTVKGFIGIYRIESDSILWMSKPLSFDFAGGVLGFISEAREINNDTKIEIIVVQGKSPIETRQLWIFNWDGKNGKLITQTDEDGESLIYCYGEYWLRDIDHDGISEITGEWYATEDAEEKTTVTYSWNGSLYGNWGKTSKYFSKKIKR